MADPAYRTTRLMTEHELLAFQERTEQFHAQVNDNLARLIPHPEPRYQLALKSALLSAEHGVAAFLLVSQGLFSPGISLLRPQFETLVRGIWLMYSASDDWVDKLDKPLTMETAQAAKNALMIEKMLLALGATESAPKLIIAQLEECRSVLMQGLNSYTHGGFHPLARVESGYPPPLVYDVLRNSNAVTAITAQLAAIATGDPQNMEPVRTLHADFADCFPTISN